ncbi:hypothetical protein [Actinomadura sp. SCN-SB]|uniref:hypothetical protein n=1 Tax=Actinomadura sp. SCN-SB TaxID=3373092 RepID=UPI003753DA6E
MAEAKLVVLPEPVRMAFTLAETAGDALKGESPQEAGYAILGKALEVVTLAMFQTVDLAAIAPLVKAANDEIGGKTAIVDPGTLQHLVDGMEGPHRTAAQKLLDGVKKFTETLQEPEPPPPPVPQRPVPELERPQEPKVGDDTGTPPPPKPPSPHPSPPPPEPPGLDFGWH